MSREINADFVILSDFVDKYNLSHLLSNPDFVKILKREHKRYFSYLVYISEIVSYVDKIKYKTTITQTQLDYIKESCSDIGMSYFNLFHGCYKSSKLLLRSSIETFLKGFCCDEIPGIFTETSMFKMFEDIKNTTFFIDKTNKEIFNILHQQYKLLCADVHTATHNNMGKVSSLNYFPTFNLVQSESVCVFCEKLVSCYLTLLAIKYNEQFHEFHYKNKDIILESIPKKYRPKIQNID